MYTKSLAFALAVVIVGCFNFHGAKAEQSTNVLGRDPGSECADAAGLVAAGRGPTNQGVLACNMALRDAVLNDRDRAEVYVNLGVLHESAANHEAAIVDDNSALFFQPYLPEAYLNRGVANASLHRFGDAVADYTRAISLNPAKPAIIYFNRALSNEDKGDLKAAYRDYQTALRLAPDWAEPAQQLGRFTVTRPAMG